jgi:hypothetical protein
MAGNEVEYDEIQRCEIWVVLCMLRVWGGGGGGGLVHAP